ncbi:MULTISPECIES: TetR/AcrR family transcriptional regulator [Novosphingobium]|uniref:HTH tetR-type domain-containing protein n=1 Tax=Novosphingobium guangzhouense TaxID=1850347 RepID=A0A2K2G505_9SPHN|nr:MULTISPECIES: TetR/AcrR family transcriptional regulator [Novosphingobium]PNU06102.1 hypothetical protein A8V01_13695 [Novosphingobium guangzhouense]QSR19545.1 hypothetical protein CA833_20495 [Novosphingobium sp. KA1]
MAYPKKIDGDKIVAAAVELLVGQGSEALSLRKVAGRLGVVPNAIYRHFEGLDALVAAVADEAARRMLQEMDAHLNEASANEGTCGEAAIRAIATAYDKFARENPDLYLLIVQDTSLGEAKLERPRFREQLWLRVCEAMGHLVGSADGDRAAMILWGMLHGLQSLRSAHLIECRTSSELGSYPVDVLLHGLRSAKGAAIQKPLHV